MPVNRITQTTYSLDEGSPFLKYQYVETSLHPLIVSITRSAPKNVFKFRVTCSQTTRVAGLTSVRRAL